MSTEKILIIVSISILVLSLIYNILYYLCLYGVYQKSFSTLSASDLVGSFVAVSVLYGVWSIIYFSWTYVDTNRRNLIQRLQLEASMKDLELKTIRANLQPHFIFNSLNSIRALIDEDPQQARAAITHISNILRYTITNQDSTDTLSNELRLVDDYLMLEKIRFEERLQIEKQVNPATLPLQVPTMMLQTLVENAIKHGISAVESGGKILIRSAIINHQLILEVLNTGSLNEGSKSENSLGFGLQSSRQRLRLLYGDQADFSIFEQEGMVCVRIKINIHLKP